MQFYVIIFVDNIVYFLTHLRMKDIWYFNVLGHDDEWNYYNI